MQSQPTAIPSSTTIEDLPPHDSPSSQHGCLQHVTHAHEPAPPRAGDGQEQNARDAALAAALQQSLDRSPSPQQRLNARSSPSPPAYNRIAEYEKASTPQPRKREGPVFEVIKKPRHPDDDRSVIQELPNEVLTHLLAHLSPSDLASIALVCKRFHDLVNGPHAWRSAFAHFFPGAYSLEQATKDDDSIDSGSVRVEKRHFTRLTALASWRSEYIIRTRLLRSLARGKPAQVPGVSSSSRGNVALPLVMYKSQLHTTINHIHATFEHGGINKRMPRFIHGAHEFGAATTSDPLAAKVDSWGLSDPQVFLQFSERFPGDAQYGLGPGDVVGVPNSMDVSQPYGMVYGEGFPGGMTYFRSVEEMRGRFLAFSTATSAPGLGVPRLVSSTEAVTAVWIAKSSAIPSLSSGVVGIMTGTSLGVVTAYSLGSLNGTSNRDHRFERGEITARWMLSPGVPIVALAVDSQYSPSRYAQNRIWAVAMNALGEIFYLTKFPKRAQMERGPPHDSEVQERNAWKTGRSVYWNLVEPSRRVARVDPYAETSVDGSYSPRSSWNGMCLGDEQIKAETREIEAFATRKPKDFQKMCHGWDMRRKLEIDFAGDDGNNAGENVIVVECGLDEGSTASVKRFSRLRVRDRSGVEGVSTPALTTGSTEPSHSPSIFGPATSPVLSPQTAGPYERLEDAFNAASSGPATPRPLSEEWRSTSFSLGGLKNVQITATAIDNSIHAVQTTSEDQLLGFSGKSVASSPSLTPQSPTGPATLPADIPGQRARLFGIGTKLGAVLLWDARAPVSRALDTVNTIEPVRMIHTDSPEISSLALSSLYLVHGGNDGLVQTWDPLGSSLQPIRTLHSRFSSRARRDLARANASPQGVGINLYAAGAICLDPDATVLRGVVSLGNQLRYWSYSSSAADQYKSSKRRLRHGQRGSNTGGGGFTGGVRTNLKNYIAHEQAEMDREQIQRKKESERFAGRFGTELLDGSEEEMLAYAAMLSQETLEQENMRRMSDTSTANSTAVSSAWTTGAPTPAASLSPGLSAAVKSDDELDADIAEAIRQSLATSPSQRSFDIPIRQAKPKGRKGSSARPSPQVSPMLSGASKAAEMSDLDFAIQLSLAEENSKQESTGEAFPGLPPPRNASSTGSKGKGRLV